MPFVVSREVAVARVVAELGGEPCLVCALVSHRAGLSLEIARDEHCAVFVARYALRFGHVLVASLDHATSHAELGEARWLAIARAAHRAAVAIERELAPVRVYVASLGTALETGVPMSSPHVHVHVVPLATADEKPSTVLTWSRGVVDATADEWLDLRDRLARRYAAL